jgi:HD-GYP domain-containing protein (c-di-GMP phosphodiesterase class II)
MIRFAKSDILVRFAALSLLVVGLIGVLAALIGDSYIGKDIRGGSAAAVAQSIAPQIEARLADLDLREPLSGPALEEFDSFISLAVLSDETTAIRIRNSEGTILYSSRAGEIGQVGTPGAELEAALQGRTASTVANATTDTGAAGDAGQIFRVFAPLTPVAGGPVVAGLEIEQSYDSIAARIASSRRTFHVTLGFGLVALYLLLQFMAWSATRAVLRAYGRISYFYRTGQELRASLDIGEVLTQAARHATVLGRGQLGLVALRHESDDSFIVRATYDRKQETASQQYRKVDEWFLHRVMASDDSLVTTQAAKPYRDLFGRESGDGTVGLLGVPLGPRDRRSGVILVARFDPPHVFRSKEIGLVDELAEHAAVAIDQADLLTRLRTYATELELNYDSTLKALMAAMDEKNAATEGHSERVAQLTLAIAREMGIPDERLSDIERGALLHDVGKVGVPNNVLHKRQTLTQKEWQAMQRHPLLAGLLMSKVGLLEGALPILLYHHERFDGQGYPFGLAGDKIPLEARIFAVVDAYDAITSDRPYREALSHREALEEIVENAGAQFDPAVIEAFKTVLERMPELRNDTKEVA